MTAVTCDGLFEKRIGKPRCRPGEGRGPYAGAELSLRDGGRLSRNNYSLRLWAPAFAGATGGGFGKRSPLLTIFTHCGQPHFSSRTAGRGRSGNEPSTVLAENFPVQGFGNADSWRKSRDFGWDGGRRPRPRDFGCVPAHPPYWRSSASYRPLRAVWAFAPGHSGVRVRSRKPFSAPKSPAHTQRNLQR